MLNVDKDRQIVLNWTDGKSLTLAYNEEDTNRHYILNLFDTLAQCHITYTKAVEIASSLMDLNVIWRYWTSETDEVFYME